jgi:hypothetical protein
MYDWLLFLHLLSAFGLFVAIVVWSAVVLGAGASGRTLSVTSVIWDAAGGGTIVFGVWLALYLDGYDILDGWIIAALVLWAAGAELARRVRKSADEGDKPAVARWHWAHTAVTVLLLADMIWKPGA